MLLGEQGGGYEHRHLFTIMHGEKRGTQRHLGLAEADVAAHQPVHGARCLHVAQHLVDDACLVGGFFEREGGGERIVVVVRRCERMAGAALAQCLDLEQFHGRIPGLFARAPLGLVPGIAAEFMQRRLIRVGTGVARDPRQVRDRNVELVAALVFEGQEFGRAVAHIHGLQAAVAADAMIFVHHRIAQMQLGQIADDRADVAIGLGAPPALRGAFAVQLRLGDDGERRIRQPQALFQIGDREREWCRHGDKCRPVGAGFGIETMVVQQGAQHFAPPRGFGDQQHSPLVLFQPVE